MRKLFILFIIAGLTMPLLAGNYSNDKAHTSVGFNVSHMVIAKVNGEFKDFEIDLSFDPDNLPASRVSTTIQIASVNTDENKRDNHLRSPDFFNAAKYPVMTFVSDNIQKTTSGYVANGTLTIRGISKKIGLPFTVSGPIKDPSGNTRIGISAQTTINRHDFNVKWSKTMDGGGLVVGNDVEIKISAEFIKNKK